MWWAIHCFNLAGGGGGGSHLMVNPPHPMRGPPPLMSCFEMGQLQWTTKEIFQPMPLLYDSYFLDICERILFFLGRFRIHGRSKDCWLYNHQNHQNPMQPLLCL